MEGVFFEIAPQIWESIVKFLQENYSLKTWTIKIVHGGKASIPFEEKQSHSNLIHAIERGRYETIANDL